MEVFGQYELQRLIRDGQIRTFSARELRSGRMLLVHQLDPHSAMFETVQRMGPADLALLVSAGELEGRRYIVTYDLPMLHDFERFVRERTPAVAGVPSAEAKPAAASQPDDFARLFGAVPELAPELPASSPPKAPGEFTRLFQTPLAAPGAPGLSKGFEPTKESDSGEFTKFFRVSGVPAKSDDTPKVFSPPPTSTIVPKPAPIMESGEATKLFETPVTPGTPPQSPTATQPAQAAEPGEFTRMFRAPSPTQPAAAPLSAAPPPVKPSEPGEFTKIFRGPPASPPTSGPPMGQVAPSTGPGEFTQMSQAPSAPGSSESAKPQSGSLKPGEFTKFFSPGLVSSPVPEYPKPAQEPARRSERDPSEFTKMFGRPSNNVPGNILGDQAGPEPPIASQDPVSGGGATGIFARPAPLQPEIAPVRSSAKGDYTRMFEAPAPSPAQEQPQQPPAPVAQQPPATSSARSYLPLILILSILGVLGIILILYFALKT